MKVSPCCVQWRDSPRNADVGGGSCQRCRTAAMQRSKPGPFPRSPWRNLVGADDSRQTLHGSWARKRTRRVRRVEEAGFRYESVERIAWPTHLRASNCGLSAKVERDQVSLVKRKIQKLCDCGFFLFCFSLYGLLTVCPLTMPWTLEAAPYLRSSISSRYNIF